MLERTQVFELRDKYQGKKSSGYDIDEGNDKYLKWIEDEIK